jgi:hypothetical protein
LARSTCTSASVIPSAFLVIPSEAPAPSERSDEGRDLQLIAIVAALAWLAGFAFVATVAVRGLKGGPVRLSFRGGGGAFLVTGPTARAVGAIFLIIALMMLALPALIWAGMHVTP